jgi:hypothetical protein
VLILGWGWMRAAWMRVAKAGARIRLTGDPQMASLLGRRPVGGHGEASQVVRLSPAAIHNRDKGSGLGGVGDLDLSYTPPLNAPWDTFWQVVHASGARARQEG